MGSASFPKSHLSLHAATRLSERFFISSVQLLKLLNTGHGKRIGNSTPSYIVHRMLWSHVDEQLVFVIQDILDGTILTVLTHEIYCRKYAKNVTEKRIQTEINKMVHAGLAPSVLWRPGMPKESVIVYAEFWDSNKPFSVGGWKGAVESVHLEKLGEKYDFWVWVAKRIHAGGEIIENVVSVKGRFSGGDIQDIPYRLDTCRSAVNA